MLRKTLIRIVLICAVLAAVVALGRGGQSAVTTDTAAPTVQQWRQDSIYLTAARGHDVEGTDGELLSTARNLCHDAGTGRSLIALVIYAQQRHNLTAQDGAYLVGVAVRTYCPQQLEHLGQETGGRS